MKLTFSQRTGNAPIPSTMQSNGMSRELRTSLWNVLLEHWPSANANVYLSDGFPAALYKLIWSQFFKLPIDSLPAHAYEAFGTLKPTYFAKEFSWFRVYDFFEFIVANFEEEPWVQPNLSADINAVLEREFSAYRLVDGQFVQITDDHEIQEVTATIANTKGTRFAPVATHISRACQLLFDRQSPDPRNSFKESISAVEAAAVIIAGDPKADLSTALAILEQKHQLHSALKQAFTKLYAYASDGNGVRHKLIDESTCTPNEAKYMLIACSAFVNYLIAETSQD